MHRRLLSLTLLSLLIVTALATRAAAQSPEALASSLAAASPVVVTGRVTAMESRWDPSGGAIYTYVTVAVTDRLKGDFSEPTIVIKQMGGRLGDVGLFIGDQASYAIGEDMLVFLAVRPRDGTLYPAGFELGKWRLVTSNGELRAVPPTAGSADIAGPASAAASGLALDSVRTIVTDTPAPDGAVVTRPSEMRLAGPAFAFLPTGGNPARWHQVDEDVDVEVFTQTPPGGVGGQTQLENAMGIWSIAGGTRLTLRFAGAGPPPPSNCSAYNPTFDRRILLFYNDPCGEISSLDVAFGIGGGYFTGGDRRTFNGTTFDAFVQGVAILKASGPHTAAAGCFQDALTHVLGHTVGLGDTTSGGARMRGQLEADCATHGGYSLGADDINGLRALYPAIASGGSPPNPPTAVTHSVVGDIVTINWTPAATGGAPTTYFLDAGTISGQTNIGTFTVQAPTTSLVVGGVPPGTYYVRVRARNVLGTSGASPERTIIVGQCTPPNTPGALSATVVDQFVSVNWTAPAGGAPVQGYTLSAGTAPGLSNILVAPMPASALGIQGVVGFGDYHVRVQATNVCGASAPTADLLVRVQPCTAPPNAPSNLTLTQNGAQVILNWTAPAGATPAQYVLVVGSVSGGTDVLVLPTGNQLTAFSANAPPGRFFVRIVALNACGISGFSNEIEILVP